MERSQRLLLDWRIGLLATVASTAIVTAALIPFRGIGLLNECLVYLLLTLFIASTWGRQVGIFAAVVTNVSFRFFFVHPLYQITVVENDSNVWSLIVFLLVSVIGGTLVSEVRRSAEESRRRQAETQALLDLSRTMIGRTEPQDALQALCAELVRVFKVQGAAVLGASGGWQVLASAGQRAEREPGRDERLLAERAADQVEPMFVGQTGLGSRRLRRLVSHSPIESHEPRVFAPLRVGDRTLGILRLDGRIGETAFADEPQSLLNAFVSEAALAVQRVELAGAAAHAQALREADEMKSALMASISHDLKTPLATIKASVSSLLDRSVAWSPEDIEEFEVTIDSQADRLNRVISDILDLNRIESGVIKPKLRDLDVITLLNDAKERTAAATEGREVLVDSPEDLELRGDESLLLHALVNLIENAAKYSHEGGTIRLSADRRAGVVEISVADEGPGIAPADLPHVFERFYRAAEQNVRVKGSGLGLAIVKGFVTLSGGVVRVESSPEMARFVISLPAARAAVAV